MRTAVALAAMSLVLFAAGCQPADPDPSAATTPPAAPDAGAAGAADAQRAAVPALRLPTLDGQAWDLADQRGKWVVVNYWATWCRPCLEEMPELSALASLRSHVEVIGLAYEDIEPGAIREFLDRHPVTYPIAIIDTLDPPADFPTPRGLPMTWLIAPDGRVAQEFLGPVTARVLEEAIAAAGGPAPGEPVVVPEGGGA